MVAVVEFVHLPSLKEYVIICSPGGAVERLIVPVMGLMSRLGEVYVPVSSPVRVTDAVPVVQYGDPV